MPRGIRVAAILIGLVAISVTYGARAQQPAGQPGWTFNIAPYTWLPSVNATRLGDQTGIWRRVVRC